MSRWSFGRSSSAWDVVVRPGELAEAWRSSPRTMAGEMWSARGANAASDSSRRCVALKWTVWDWLAGLPSTYGRQVAGHAAAGDALSKLNRCLKLPIAVTETPTWPTLYSWFTQWFLLEFVPMDRDTWVLQVCLKDQGLVWPRIQTTKLPRTRSANCVDSDLGKFG